MADQTGLIVAGAVLIILPDDPENPEKCTSGTVVQSLAKGSRSGIPIAGDRVFYTNAHMVEWDIDGVTHVLIPWRDVYAMPERPGWPEVPLP